jgi:two-component system sensor histidine kinase UhpB
LIADRFNQLAAALDTTREENTRLCRDLITVQEEERREIATELHDEVGPCLFGIVVSASSIEKQVGELPLDQASHVSSRVSEILSISERLKGINRALLKKLRPIALGRITLSELIRELIAEFERRHASVRFLILANGLSRSYGERIDLTVYRCIQEGITNALRHGMATSVIVELVQDNGEHGPIGTRPAEVVLFIRDNGVGIGSSTPVGFGIATMRERVRTHGGRFSIGRNWPSGTTININIPVPARDMNAARTGELIETA